MNSNGYHSPLGPLATRLYETLVPKSIRIGLHNRLFVYRTARWEEVKNKPASVISRVAPGIRMKLFGDSLLCELLYFGQFEQETREFFDAFLRSGDVFLDIGANVGLYTLAAARIVGRLGHVHAFEPATQTYERLNANVELNRLRNVTTHRVALSHENAQAQLTLANGGFDAWNSLGKPYMGETTGSETVTTVTLDTFAKQHGLSGKNCALKIDVEGWENQVLTGGGEFLSGKDAPLLLVEFTEEAAALAGSSCAALYRTLEGLGFEMFSVSSDPAQIQPFPFQEHFPNVNLLATKNIAAVRARLAAAPSV